MKQKQEIFRAASRKMEIRRQRAESEAERRLAEVSRKLPDIALCRGVLRNTGIQLTRIVLRGGEQRKEAIAELRAENEAAQRRIRQLLTENGYPENYLDPPNTCTDCNDTGFRPDGSVCRCLKQLRGELLLQELADAHKLIGSSFDDFSLSYYSAQTDRETGVVPAEHMRQILTYCQHYADGFSLSSDSLLLLGKTGLGKTHLSLAIAQEAAKRGHLVQYGTAQEHLRQLEREHFSREQADETLDELLNCDLLIIDDLGSEFPSAFTTAMIYQLIDTRLSKGKPCIVSTNLNWAELEDRYTQRVVSRLSSSYVTLRFVGQDIRQQKRLSP